jgi:chemotaxis protein methyltransferase CheR
LQATEPSEREFVDLRNLIHSEAGIFLANSKRALLYSRLGRRVRELGLGSFGDYHARVRKDGSELARMLDLITTNETYFFREQHHFDYLEQRLIPQWTKEAADGRRARRIRVWSAGCSSGEEPFSIAMVLLARLTPEDGWTIDILASDLSTRMLDTARSATWSLERVRSIPDRFLKRFMLHGIGTEHGKLRAGPELREVVRFERLNLAEMPSPAGGPFDLILCRNVLIYFDSSGRARVINHLTSQLRPGGRLFVGHAESIRASDRLECLYPTIYALGATP